MAETINHAYEVSQEGAVRHWEVSYAKMEDATPTETQPAALIGSVKGTQLTGTVLTIDADASLAIVDFTPSMVYYHSVRNVLTYSGAAEATFDEVDEGDAIFYDRSSTMPAGVKLSKSPLDKDGNANPLFGFAVLLDEDDVYPKGTTSASTQTCAVMQVGAGR